MEAITYLPNMAKGVEITPSIKGDNELCETCYLTTIKKQWSRQPIPQGSCLFERVHMDLVELTLAYNRAIYAFHIYCDWYHIIRNYNLINKWEACEKLKEFRE
jgi:hypothetical protein